MGVMMVLLIVWVVLNDFVLMVWSGLSVLV